MAAVVSEHRNEMVQIQESFMNYLSNITNNLGELEKLNDKVNQHEKRIQSIENENNFMKSANKSLTLTN